MINDKVISGAEINKPFAVDKRAVPELLLKQQIAVLKRDSMIRAYETLVYTSRLNNGRIGLPERARMESEIIGLFMHIKDMIVGQTPYSKMLLIEQKLYDDLIKLQRGSKFFDKNRIVTMMNYLLRKLHDLNLTNLLIKESDPFITFEKSLGI